MFLPKNAYLYSEPDVPIDEILVDDRIADVHFACDLGECKGACCTLNGGRGAPVTDEEVDETTVRIPVVKKYLPKEHTEWIERHGLVEGAPGYLCQHNAGMSRHAFLFIMTTASQNVRSKKGFTTKKFSGGSLSPATCFLYGQAMDPGTIEV